MKLIDPSVELIVEQNPYKLVERIGRTCYKSESAITEDSCYGFVERLVKRKHFAMLEHARFNFIVTSGNSENIFIQSVPSTLFNIQQVYVHKVPELYKINTWVVNVSMSHLYNPKWKLQVGDLFDKMRDIVEAVYKDNGDPKNPERSLQLVDTVPDKYDNNRKEYTYASAKFIVDRGISHELVRHRCAVAQESTRYCDYSKDKFGGELTFVKPSEYDTWIGLIQNEFKNMMQTAENSYKWLVTKGKLTPQIARAWLPNALKTEVILTMPMSQWNHFFNMRYFGETGAPHPDMKVIAGKLHQLMHSYIPTSFLLDK